MERLAEIREHRALTLRELGELSGVDANTINQIELGRRKARPSTIRKLARALGVEPEELTSEPVTPKAQAPLPSDAPDHEKAREWRLLGYVRPWILLLDDISERWEKAAADGTFSLDTYMEFATNIEVVHNATNSLIEGLKRHQGIDAMQGDIGYRFRQSLLRSAETATKAAEAAVRIYGQDDLARARARQAEPQSTREADGQDARSRDIG